jgi:AcrR family transcriptional regulator
MTAAPANFAEGVTIKDVTVQRVTAEPMCAEQVPVPVRHRRRGETLERAIHAAVFTELAEVGYAAFTIESVASRAHTGKASIYRRWPTKQDLVLDAFCGKFGETMQLIEGSLDDDTTTRDVLLQMGRRMCEVSAEATEAIRVAAGEMSRDAELSAALDERVNCPKRELMLNVLERGVERGEVRPEAACEMFAEILPAMIMFKLILQNQAVSDDALISIVDNILMPLLRPA